MPIIDVAPTSRAKCSFCGRLISQGELRVPLSEKGYMGYTSTKYAHLMCYKAKPPISITAFIGHEDLSDENKNILRNYVDTRNKSYVATKKRAAEDNIDSRAVKKFKSGISMGRTLFDATVTNCVNILPTEIIATVFMHLTPKDIVSAMQVCKRWCVLSENESLWRDYCQLRCPDLPKDEADSWKQQFNCLAKQSCVECVALTSSNYYFYPLGARLCLTCRTLDKYKLIKKTDLKDRFRLTDDDLIANGLRPQFITCNGTRAHFYLRSLVEKVAAEKTKKKLITKNRK